MLTVRKIRITAFVASLLTLFLVGLGGFVRATGAGLACPDWPLCYGRVIPPGFGGGVFQEVFHRYTAGAVGILTAILATLIYRQRSTYARLWKFYRSILLLLSIQIVLGGLTVLLLLNPFIVTSHLALGTLFLICWGMVASEKPRKISNCKDTSKTFAGRMVLLLLSLTFVQVLLGGFVGSSGAALACPDLPLCGENFLPENPFGAQIIHMAHRTLGVALFIVAILTFLAARRSKEVSKQNKTILFNTILMFVLQIAVGLSNVAFRIPVDITVVHLLLAELILLTLVFTYRGFNPAWRVFDIEPDQIKSSKSGSYNSIEQMKFVSNL